MMREVRAGRYEESPLSEDIGDLWLRLDRGKELCTARIDGEESIGGRYESGSSTHVPLRQDGERQGLMGNLWAAVPDYGLADADSGRMLQIGSGSATYYVEDRALAIDVFTQLPPGNDPVDLEMLFESYAKARFPGARTLYRFQQPWVPEPLLRRLGYRLIRENRRKASGVHNAHPMRTWAK